jgi:hypothetical protein
MNENHVREKSWTILATLILAGSLLASTVQADAKPQHPFTTEWSFTATNGSHMDDYSTNLGEELAATLPVSAVNDGWACTRKPLGHHNDLVVGEFSCSNGTETHTTVATCSTRQNDKSHSWMALTFDNGVSEETLTFDISCQSVQQ